MLDGIYEVEWFYGVVEEGVIFFFEGVLLVESVDGGNFVE